MNTICLIVVSILGSYCYASPENYVPPGECYQVQNHVLVCETEPEDLQARASWYNPEIGYGKDWDVNCQDPCHMLGDNTPVADGFGEFLACPPGWYGKYIEFEDIGSRQCRDSGGAIVPTCGEVYVPGSGREFHCYITVDFLERAPPKFAYLLLDFSLRRQKSVEKDVTERVVALHRIRD